MEALFIKIVNMSIAASWLILVVMVLRLLLKKAPKAISCVLWGMVALRLILPFSFESVMSLIPSAETVPEQTVNQVTLTEINSGFTVIDTPVNEYLTSYNEELIDCTVIPQGETVNSTLGTLSVIWLSGICALLLYSFISYGVLRYRVRASINIKDNIYVCDDINSPFILGTLKPRIYVPSGLTEQQMHHVISHENAHIKRLDFLWKPLGFTLLAVHWFNPLVWGGYVLLCRDIEFACDEKVIKQMHDGEVKEYSKTLLYCSVPRKMILACPVAFGEVGVKQRIKTVLSYKKPVFWVILAAVIICIATAVFFLTNPPSDKVNDGGGASGVDSEETNERLSSDKIYVNRAADEESIGLQFRVGDRIRIYYDGIIQELYPAIIPGVKRIVLVDNELTNLYFKTESVKAVTVSDKNDGIYVNAANAGGVALGEAPIFLFDSYTKLKNMIDAYASSDDAEGKDALLKQFNTDYFKENKVILVYVAESSHVVNRVSRVYKVDEGLYVDFNQMYLDTDMPLTIACKLVAVGIEKSIFDGVGSYHAKPEIDEELLQEASVKEIAKAGSIPYAWKTYGLDGNYNRDVVKRAEKNLLTQKGPYVYRFDHASQLHSVGQLFGGIPGYPTPKASWYGLYDEQYFQTKSLFVVYISSGSGSFSYEIAGLEMDKDGLTELTFVSNIPETFTDDMRYYLIAIEVEKSDLTGFSGLKVKQIERKERKEQMNIVSIKAPDGIEDIPYHRSYSVQATGRLGKDEDIFTKAANKDSLDNTDAVHLPIHIARNKTEFDALMEQYRGVATVELPAGVLNSLYYGTGNKTVALIFIQPGMAEKTEYNLAAARIKDGKLVFALVDDGWHNGKVDLGNKSFGWIIAVNVLESDLAAANGFDAVVCQSAEEYNSYFG